MCRLTLNVLLSFAQFEREVVGERERDKIAASKRKGNWVGGPLGYRGVGKKLEIVSDEAAPVQRIFADYLRLGSIRAGGAAGRRRTTIFLFGELIIRNFLWRSRFIPNDFAPHPIDPPC
jgi:DNA invertase Pin-like site-specific DNA recombinase